MPICNYILRPGQFLVKNLCKYFIRRFRVEDSNLLGGMKK